MEGDLISMKNVILKPRPPKWWDLIIATITSEGIPLTSREIWEKSEQYRNENEFNTVAKLPADVIYDHCYQDIQKNGDESKVIQTSSRPTRFFLRELADAIDVGQLSMQLESSSNKIEKSVQKKFIERDLHPYLVAYASQNSHFNAHLKTIYHEYSLKKERGGNLWLHPDLVGVHFSFQDYDNIILSAQKALSANSVSLFAFEVKIKLDFSNLRHNYFQAVSNSSWANEGYLVSKEIDDDESFRDELERLNHAFGIGVIKLNPAEPFASEILFPARINPEVDWNTANRLATENPDFKDFLQTMIEDCRLDKVTNEKNYDDIKDEAILFKEGVEKGIIKLEEYTSDYSPHICQVR
ncbi:MAG TPA: HrgA protein [Candidatus Lokiarchaeia archaeon]|nr:HrgA protein [Candidatus Lokiarchaeia archaeon]